MNNLRILGVLLILIGLGTSIYFGGQYSHYKKFYNVQYGRGPEYNYLQERVTTNLSLTILGAASAVVGIIVSLAPRRKDKSKKEL